MTVSEVGEPMAALGFIHVVSSDQHGKSVGCEAVNLIPKITPRLGVDTRGGLIEEQELGRVNQTRG